jgi:hypothetical protein
MSSRVSASSTKLRGREADVPNREKLCQVQGRSRFISQCTKVGAKRPRSLLKNRGSETIRSYVMDHAGLLLPSIG